MPNICRHALLHDFDANVMFCRLIGDLDDTVYIVRPILALLPIQGSGIVPEVLYCPGYKQPSSMYDAREDRALSNRTGRV